MALVSLFFWMASSAVPSNDAKARDDSIEVPELAKFENVSPALYALGWRQLRVKERPAAQFDLINGSTIAVTAKDAAGFLYKPLRSDGVQLRTMQWSWRIDTAPPPSDLSRPGKDDRALALHVWFPVSVERDSPWDLIKSGLGQLAGLPVPGKVLTYVWGGIHPNGEKIPNPYLEEDGVIVVRRTGSAKHSDWFMESINFAKDFEIAFGYPAPPPSFVVISADTDDLKGASRAFVKDISFNG